MPAYDYQCNSCGNVQEEFFKVSDKPEIVACVKCGSEAGKILSATTVHGDEMPAWMRHPHALGCLQGSTEKPIESRSEYNRYLKQHGIAEVSATEG